MTRRDVGWILTGMVVLAIVFAGLGLAAALSRVGPTSHEARIIWISAGTTLLGVVPLAVDSILRLRRNARAATDIERRTQHRLVRTRETDDDAW